MKFPFRFYGSSPSDWAEGANLGHLYEAQFARQPTDAERVVLAKAWYAATATGVLEPGSWLWSGRFALIVVGERFTQGRKFLDAMIAFFDSAHALVPLSEVVYVNAKESHSDWDEWSLEQGQPGPGPAAEHQALIGEFRRGVDPALPEYARDSVFDETVESAQTERVASKVLAALDANPGPGKIGVRAVSAVVEPPARSEGGPRFEPPAASFRRDDRYQWPPGDHPIEEIRARAVAWVVTPDRSLNTIAWFVKGERREAQLPGYGTAFVLDTDGERALLLQRKRSWSESDGAWFLDLREGTPKRWYERADDDGSMLNGVAFAADDQWALLSDKRLKLFKAGSTPQQVAMASVANPEGLHAARGGKLLLVEQEAKLSVWAVAGPTLKRLATFDAPLRFAFEKDGGLYLRHGDALFELTQVDETLAAATPKPKKAARGKQGPVFEPRLSAQPVELPEPPLSVPEGVTRAFEDPAVFKNHIVMDPSGRAAAMCELPNSHRGDMVRYLDGNGTRVDITDALRNFCKAGYFAAQGISMAPSGRYLMILLEASGGFVVRLDLASGTLEMVLRGTPPYTCGFAAISAEDVVVLSGSALDRHRRTPSGEWEQCAELKLSKVVTMGNPAEVAGQHVLPVLTRSAKPLQLISLNDGKLKKLAHLTGSVDAVEWRDTALFAQDSQRTWWRVEGLGE